MKRWRLGVLIMFLLVFFDIPQLLAHDEKLLVVEPFKISDFSQLIVLPLDMSSTVLKEKDLDLKPPEEVLQKAQEFLVKGLKKNSPKKLNILFNGNQDTPGTLLLKIVISKMWIENNTGKAWVDVKGDMVDAQSQKILLAFRVKRDCYSMSGKEGYAESLLKDFKEIGDGIGDLLDENFFKQSHKVNSSKHEPGKYTNWKGTCNEVEIIKPFNFINYSYINVKPLDTSSTIIPPKTDENDLHNPTSKYLSKIDKPFFKGIQENVEDEVNILEVFFNKEDNQVKDLKRKVLVIKGKVNKVDPGNFKVADWGKVEIEGEVTDAQSNELLLKFKHEQSSSKGKSKSFEDFMKGAFEETLDAAIHWNTNDICELLKKNKLPPTLSVVFGDNNS